MDRFWIFALALALLCGCGGRDGRMEHPEDPHGRYEGQIAAAQRVLDQNEDWGSRAEWEVVEKKDGWEATAWRVEHPDRKGPDRYVPWGYLVVELDGRMNPVSFHRKEGAD